MGKMVMVISGAATAFILALTAGAVYAYRSLSMPSSSAADAQQQSVTQADSTIQLAVTQTPTTATDVSPQDAASIAAKFLNRTDLYSVEISDVQGARAYKVTFSSGDAAFVSLQGQMLSILPAPTAGPVTTMGGSAPRQSKGGGSGDGSRGGDGEHESEGGG